MSNKPLFKKGLIAGVAVGLLAFYIGLAFQEITNVTVVLGQPDGMTINGTLKRTLHINWYDFVDSTGRHYTFHKDAIYSLTYNADR